MIRTLRAHFLGFGLREKGLLVALLVLGTGTWVLGFSSRVGRFWRGQNATTQQLKTQDDWLRRKDEIDAITRAAAAQMDPTKTLDATNLSVTVRQLANEADFKTNLSTGPVTTAVSTGQFSINTMRVDVTQADWKIFSTFYARLQERAPYIAITEIALQPVRGNPALVMGSLSIASFEQKH